MVALHYLKYTYDLSDESVVAGCRNAPDKKYIKQSKQKEKKYKEKFDRNYI